jgi:hypothetical protein
MKSILVRLTLVSIISCGAFLSSQAQQPAEVPLTNSAVVKLVRAGFREKTVIAIIHNRPNQFKLDPDRLIELKRSGVSENIILAMLARDESFAFSDGDWTDDSGFRMPGKSGEPVGRREVIFSAAAAAPAARPAGEEWMVPIRQHDDNWKRHCKNSASPHRGWRGWPGKIGEDTNINERFRYQVS